jgi:uncharacterized protein
MPDVVDNKDRGRFEMAVDGHTAFVTYRRSDSAIALLHAEVPQELEGRGVGSRLAKATLDAVRGEGLKVIPRCSFIAAYIAKHPEYRDLL